MTTTIREIRMILQDDMPELDPVINEIVGVIAAFTMENLENVARMNLTFHEYATISPAITDMDTLIINRALGSYTRSLCIVMYRLGQYDSQINGRPPTNEEQNEEAQEGAGSTPPSP